MTSKVDTISLALQKNLEYDSAQKRNSAYITDTKDISTKVSDRLGRLKDSSENWKNRVEVKDAGKFAVAAKIKLPTKLPFTKTDVRRCPPMVAFECANPSPLGLAKSQSMGVNLNRGALGPAAHTRAFKRSLSVPEEEAITSQELSNSTNKISATVNSSLHQRHQQPQQQGNKVVVPKFDEDELFGSFFTKLNTVSPVIIENEADVESFDAIKSTQRLGQKRGVQGPRRRRNPNKNPLRALAERPDLISEYTEVKSGVAEREVKRINLEKVAKTSHLAVEALAGLVAVEDFKSVHLKSSSIPLQQSWLPYSPLMLIHIKGRTHVQVRLVEPIFTSINRGDCYLLVTKQKLFRFVGDYANVIERTRSQYIAAIILENKDLGCMATKETLLTDDKDGEIGRYNNPSEIEFWKLLKKPQDWSNVIEAGHADEDDLFETSLIETNMIFEYKDERLVPMEAVWGSIPRYDILDEDKVMLFYFGAELYVWNGKNAKVDEKRAAIRLAQAFFQSNTNYEECYLSPLNFSQYAGTREIGTIKKSDPSRPAWCLLAKINQHMETVLFQEKFLDWPEEVKRDDLCKAYSPNDWLDIEPPSGSRLFEDGRQGGEPVNIVIENANLGRGHFYYDTDTMRHFDIVTESVDKWSINDSCYERMKVASFGHFYEGDSYIIRWIYRISCTVRELSGKISDRATVGRDRCIYYCWQGTKSSVNEKGTAALLLANELDKEKGGQMTVGQGEESSAFVRLFGTMLIHKGKSPAGDEIKSVWRMFIVTGNDDCETVLTEVHCHIRQLRSRTCFILVHGQQHKVIVWQGRNSPKHIRELAVRCAEKLASDHYDELFMGTSTENEDVDTEIEELEEGEESEDCFEALQSKDRDLYWCESELLEKEFTPRLFHFTSTNGGTFEATELFYNLRYQDRSSPFPFRQCTMYGARQPTIFLVDNGNKLWLWFGWWPTIDEVTNNTGTQDDDERDPSLSDNRAGEFRWLDERRAALETCIEYWRAKQMTAGRTDSRIDWGFVVWAGLEPLEFQAIFPDWVDNAEARDTNKQDGRSSDLVTIEAAFKLLSIQCYPLDVLLARPLPEGVDPKRLERYLSDDEFESCLLISRAEYKALPTWKQTKIKKDAGLF